jgi:hypothetical protein
MTPPCLPHSPIAVGDPEPAETRSPFILTAISRAFTIHPLPGCNGVSKLRFLNRRMTRHLHTRWAPACFWVDRVVQSSRGFLAFSRSIVVTAFAALLQASGPIRLLIFEILCLLIRTFARVLIGMQDSLFSILGRDRLAGYWQSHEVILSSPNWGRVSRWGRWKLYCILATGAVVGTIGWALLTFHSVLHHKEVEASDRTALDAIVRRIIDVESYGDHN